MTRASPQPQADAGLRRNGNIFGRVLWLLLGYCALSCLTLPFIGRVWLGELPVLAIIQWPKISMADWLRTHVVMEAVTYLGFSKGSFSPDYILARPYALAIAYLIPLSVLGIICLRLFRLPDDRLRLLILALPASAIADYACTLIFADGRLLTIY